MQFKLYLICFIVALVGMALQTVLKMKSLQDKSRVANIEFKPSQYFQQDWLSILASVLTIIMFLLFLDNILKWRPDIVNYIKIGFAFVGYTGSDIASKLFGVLDKKINNVIDTKTNISDGITEVPTTKIK